jgi:hypothetical protein
MESNHSGYCGHRHRASPGRLAAVSRTSATAITDTGQGRLYVSPLSLSGLSESPLRPVRLSAVTP